MILENWSILMKQPIITTSLILLFALYTSPVSADPVHDCSSGCWIVACDGSSCTLWRCDESGCTEEKTFPDNNHVQSVGPGMSLEGQSRSTSRASDRSVVKICGPLECSVYGLDVGKATLLGTFDNVSPVIDEIGRNFLEKSGSGRLD